MAINGDSIDANELKLYESIRALSSGKNPFGVFGLGTGNLRRQLGTIRVRGQAPHGMEDWQHVLAMIQLREEAQNLVQRWNAIAALLGLPRLAEGIDALLQELKPHKHILKVVEITPDRWRRAMADLRDLYPFGVNHAAVAAMRGDFGRVHNALRQWCNRRDLDNVQALPRYLAELSTRCRGLLFDDLRAFAERLGGEEQADEIGREWRGLRDRLIALRTKAPALADLDSLTRLIVDSGAKNWGHRLRLEPPGNGHDDPLTPGSWREAWDHARAMGFIDTSRLAAC